MNNKIVSTQYITQSNIVFAFEYMYNNQTIPIKMIGNHDYMRIFPNELFTQIFKTEFNLTNVYDLCIIGNKILVINSNAQLSDCIYKAETYRCSWFIEKLLTFSETLYYNYPDDILYRHINNLPEVQYTSAKYNANSFCKQNLVQNTEQYELYVTANNDAPYHIFCKHMKELENKTKNESKTYKKLNAIPKNVVLDRYSFFDVRLNHCVDYLSFLVPGINQDEEVVFMQFMGENKDKFIFYDYPFKKYGKLIAKHFNDANVLAKHNYGYKAMGIKWK